VGIDRACGQPGDRELQKFLEERRAERRAANTVKSDHLNRNFLAGTTTEALALAQKRGLEKIVRGGVENVGR